MAAVRFFDMQGKSHWMVTCSYFCKPPQKRLPRLPPTGVALFFAIFSTGGRWLGKVSQGEAPEGCASPEEANPSKVFSFGGALQGLLQL